MLLPRFSTASYGWPAFLADADERFVFKGEQITSGGRALDVSTTSAEVPTVFGETAPDAELVFRDAQTGLVVDRRPVPPALVNTSIAPFPVPQVGIGTLVGTDVQARFLPDIDISDYGSVGLVGVSVRHDLDQWIPVALPFELAAQGAWNRITIDDQDDSEVVDGSGWAANLPASKKAPAVPIVFYGALQYESFDVDYSYTFVGPQGNAQDLSVSQDAATSVRGTAGLSLTLALFRVNVDYAVTDDNNVVTGGVGLRF